MSKDPKKFDFQTKEQLIELLNLTIELVDKHFIDIVHIMMN